jgi:FkbM family methyltransferase
MQLGFPGSNDLCVRRITGYNSPNMHDLPRQTLRDYLKDAERALKYKLPPFRLYYRFRCLKYMHLIDREMQLLKFLVDRNRVSLDVGANVGLFTYFLARYARSVHAFEPNPLPFDLLKSVADKNVTLHQMALTDVSREVELIVPRGRKGWTSNGASLAHAATASSISVKVPGRRIDDLGIADIGFIKIDVEGHEHAVLQGAVETLKRDRPNLFIENEHAHAGDAAEQVFALLRELGYRGAFVKHGVLRDLTQFSFERDQILPRQGGDPAGYVKNFIFMPG